MSSSPSRLRHHNRHTYVRTGQTLASPTSTSLSAIMDNGEATGCLVSMLGRQLRIYTTDTRMFVGEFKCTDNECNIILAQSHEYRFPTAKALETVSESSLKLDMNSRYLGLIVVPGQHIVKIEIETPLGMRAA